MWAVAAVAVAQNDKRAFTVEGVTFTMVQVQGGTFTMGATPEQKLPRDDEKPAHQVTLSSYWIGATEVTQALWQAVMGSNPSKFKGDKLPVECVSRGDCLEFIKKLNELTGQQFRLPTEAEWEFAARGGTKSRGYQYSGSNNIDDVAWYWHNSYMEPNDVAALAANELGLYDMCGNVLEWCQDWYDSYSGDAQTDPTGPTSRPRGALGVVRGGGWNCGEVNCRSARRIKCGMSVRSNNLGLRLAL